jgi:hypothetical protein
LLWIEHFFTPVVRDVDGVVREIAVGLDAGLIHIEAGIGQGLQDIVEQADAVGGFDVDEGGGG